MPPKQVVSFPIERETLAAIRAEIEAAQLDGEEVDFSKWMRDAVRRKLRSRRARVGEEPPQYRARKKKT